MWIKQCTLRRDRENESESIAPSSTASACDFVLDGSSSAHRVIFLFQMKWVFLLVFCMFFFFFSFNSLQFILFCTFSLYWFFFFRETQHTETLSKQKFFGLYFCKLWHFWYITKTINEYEKWSKHFSTYFSYFSSFMKRVRVRKNETENK